MNEENYNAADWTQDCCTAPGGGAGNPQGGTNAGGDIFSCLPLPASCRALLRKVRAPGMCLSYRMTERMIPDMDAEKAACGADSSGGGAVSGTCGGDGPSDCGCGSDCTCGCQGGVMTSSGSLTFRLFDAALVCMAGMLVCGVCCLCGKMKK